MTSNEIGRSTSHCCLTNYSKSKLLLKCFLVVILILSVFLVPYCCCSSGLFFYLLHVNSGVELSLSLLLCSCVLSLLFLIFVVVFGFLLIYMYILMLFYCCLTIKFCHYCFSVAFCCAIEMLLLL